jgi:hypothetical protein
MEIWRPIDGYPGYEVSSLGNVRSLDRNVPRGNQTLRLKGRQLRLVFIKTNGSYRITLPGNKMTLVHRLVAQAFCDGYAEGLQVNHKNGIRTDNRFENLEWVTASENMQHSYDSLGRIGAAKDTRGATAPASKAVIAIDMVTGETKQWVSATEAARAGFCNARISECCNGRKPYHKGYYWKFSDH